VPGAGLPSSLNVVPVRQALRPEKTSQGVPWGSAIHLGVGSALARREILRKSNLQTRPIFAETSPQARVRSNMVLQLAGQGKHRAASFDGGGLIAGVGSGSRTGDFVCTVLTVNGDPCRRGYSQRCARQISGVGVGSRPGAYQVCCIRYLPRQLLEVRSAAEAHRSIASGALPVAGDGSLVKSTFKWPVPRRGVFRIQTEIKLWRRFDAQLEQLQGLEVGRRSGHERSAPPSGVERA